MRIELPWYDVNYRDSEHHNTPAGKKIEELNKFLMENWIKWWIACLDEKWKVVRRYTDRVVLEIDDSVSPEKLEKIKKMVSELLRVMWATETQLTDVFKDEESRKLREWFNNMDDYEKEKFDSMRKKLARLIETMDIIWEFVSKADELWIYVEKDFEFDRIYRTWWFDGTNWEADFKDLYDKFMWYSYKLQKAVAKKQKNK